MCKMLFPQVTALLVIAVVFLPQGQCGEQASSTGLVVDVRSYPEPGKVVASVLIPELPGLPDGSQLELNVVIHSQDGATLSQVRQTTESGMQEEVILEAADLPSGDYEVIVTVSEPSGQLKLEVRKSIHWPGQSPVFAGIRILNNLVWELLNEEGTPEKPVLGEYVVRVPCDRWLFVRTTGKKGKNGLVHVFLRENGQDVLLNAHTPDGPPVLEAMRFVKAGEHRIRVAAEGELRLTRLEVRAVPEIQHSRYPTGVPYIDQGVQYDWDFLSRYILPHVNTIITSGPTETAVPHLTDWKRRGGKVIFYTGRPGLHGRKDLEASAEVCANYWATQPGFLAPFSDGILVDEFYHENDPAYSVYTEAVKLLHERFPGKAFYPYAAGRFGKDEGSIPFAKACIEGGGYPCWEAYIAEWPTLKTALNALRRYPYQHIIPFEERLPGVTKKLIWVFGVFSFPWPYADGYASVNYNAYLDMQFQFIATHPALFGLGGMHIWRSGYCDEERLRWFGRLFRHYAIEGATRRLGTDPYLLTHIQNPDFEEGLKSWEIEPAEENSIFATKETGFGKFIGRYYRGPDSFIVMKRNPAKPNIVRQVVRDLEPGRLYSVKMLTGNYEAFRRGESIRELHDVTARMEGAELLAGPRYHYQQPFCTREKLGPFTESRPFWLNYHWLVFRATAPTANLVITDRKSDTESQQSKQQSILCTFVEVKPYIDDNH